MFTGLPASANDPSAGDERIDMLLYQDLLLQQGSVGKRVGEGLALPDMVVPRGQSQRSGGYGRWQSSGLDWGLFHVGFAGLSGQAR